MIVDLEMGEERRLEMGIVMGIEFKQGMGLEIEEDIKSRYDCRKIGLEMEEESKWN